MFGPIGIWEMVIILVVALIVFGPRKLPELGRSLGKSLGEFKRASSELRSTLDQEIRIEDRQKPTPTAATTSATAATTSATTASATTASHDRERHDREAGRRAGGAARVRHHRRHGAERRPFNRARRGRVAPPPDG